MDLVDNIKARIGSRSMKIVIFCYVAFFASVVAMAQTEEIRAAHFNIIEGTPAIDGYDPVSYFNGAPKPGKANYAYTYKGVNYLFNDYKNLEQFKQQPNHYEPAYGGWCAYAMGDTGEKVKVNPKTYKIVDDKLYLFYDFYFTNTLKDWNKNEKRLKTMADEYWAEMVKLTN